MNLLLSGYYGFGNAGDEAVLAAMLGSISALEPEARFTVTSGSPGHTVSRFNTETTSVKAVPRQSFGAIRAALRGCDLFISGGGSLLQDVTSLRNIVYYTGLMRMAQLSRVPVMVYAQGIGPLRLPLSQKLARAAVRRAKIVTVRDEASKALLQRIGVKREIEVTADPVWALTPQRLGPGIEADTPPLLPGMKTWMLGLRPWPGATFDAAILQQAAQTVPNRNAAAAGTSAPVARYRGIPMQQPGDGEVMRGVATGAHDVVHDTSRLHPREVMALCARGDAMIAMRLHALIFAAAQGIPCVAINYDPKVEALAEIIGAPLLQDLSPSEVSRLPEAVASAKPMDIGKLAALQALARRNAELAIG